MLVLTRSLEEEICIGDGIRIRILAVQGGQVRLGIEAPCGVPIHRAELLAAIRTENEAAVCHSETDHELLRSITGPNSSVKPSE